MGFHVRNTRIHSLSSVLLLLNMLVMMSRGDALLRSFSLRSTTSMCLSLCSQIPYQYRNQHIYKKNNRNNGSKVNRVPFLFNTDCSLSSSSSLHANYKDSDFESDNFVIEERVNDEDLLLNKINAHKLDENISFNEADHVYYYQGEKMKDSVTSKISEFFQKFESFLIATRMTKSKNWPREGYIHPDGKPFNIKEILKKWDIISNVARNRGTLMHYNIEMLLNNLDFSMDIPEMTQFLRFHKEYIIPKQMEPFRTEWRICAPDLSLGGSVDFVTRKSDGTYSILDWKRSKNLGTDNGNANNKYMKFAKYPLNHLADNDESKYSLQLNMYRYILKTYYDINVTSMAIASFHPDQENYFVYEVPILDKEIEYIVSTFASKKKTKTSI